MYQKLNRGFILALAITLSLTACNQGEKKEEPASTADSASKAGTDTVQPVAKQPVTDAITIAPGLYKAVHDSLGILISEAVYKPGDSSAMHSHMDYALYIEQGGIAAFYTKDGATIVNDMKTGSINIRPEEMHSVKNIGKTTIKVLLFEIHRPKTIVAPDAAMDAAKVAPAQYKVKRDTLGIRILEATYKAGDSSALHSHPDAAVYALTDGTASFTEKDGTKRTNDLKKGMAMVSGADTHTVKNVGKQLMKVLLVEVNRPRN